MENDNTKRTAAQRLEDLERGIMEAYRVLDNVVRDLATVKDAIKLLGNKTDSIAKASVLGLPLTDENLTTIMVENNVAELKTKAESLVAQGFLKETETVEDNSFIVGRELNAEGKLVNPRLQFALNAVAEPVKGKLKGAKSGDILTFDENKLKFEVLEVYTILNPADTAKTTEAIPTTETAPEAVTNTEPTTQLA